MLKPFARALKIENVFKARNRQQRDPVVAVDFVLALGSSSSQEETERNPCKFNSEND